jgi:hypothetical protein
MKYTLLEMVQTILSSMESDEVSSISDTVESQAIAKIVRDTYYDIISRDRLPEHYNLFQLEPSTDASKPVVMFKPVECKTLDWVKYDIQDASDEGRIRFAKMNYIFAEEFVERMFELNSTDPNVITFTLDVNLPSSGTSSLTILARNDQHPQYFTSFDDGTIVFDSYDASIDNTLQKSKTQCYGLLGNPWSETDNFIPNLAETKFPILINEAKMLAFAELKQSAHQEAAKRANRAWIASQKNASAIPGVQRATDKLPNYGRH